MLIDPGTGIVTVNPDLIVDPSRATGLFAAADPADPGPGIPLAGDWRVFERRDVRDEAGRSLVLTVTREGARLHEVRLVYRLPGEPESAGWETWSREAEAARQALHDMVLRETLGPGPYRYPWGEVRSRYDERGGFSLISVRYTGA